jgi:hypothetical protein
VFDQDDIPIVGVLAQPVAAGCLGLAGQEAQEKKNEAATLICD